MNPLGTWGPQASYALGGTIGCGIGIAAITLIPGVNVLFWVGVAIVSGILIGAGINGLDRTANTFDHAVKTKSVTTNVFTGAVVVGSVALAATATTAIVQETKPSVEPDPIVVEIDGYTMVPTIVEPTSTPVPAEPTLTPTLVESTADIYGCDDPDITPEEKANCGEHTYTQASCQAPVSNWCACGSNSDFSSKRWYPFHANDSEYSKIAVNTYQRVYDRKDEGGTSTTTYTFTETGYSEHTVYNGCDITWHYEIVE